MPQGLGLWQFKSGEWVHSWLVRSSICCQLFCCCWAALNTPYPRGSDYVESDAGKTHLVIRLATIYVYLGQTCPEGSPAVVSVLCVSSCSEAQLCQSIRNVYSGVPDGAVGFGWQFGSCKPSVSIEHEFEPSDYTVCSRIVLSLVCSTSSGGMLL
jgi:hypothetical protein